MAKGRPTARRRRRWHRRSRRRSAGAVDGRRQGPDDPAGAPVEGRQQAPDDASTAAVDGQRQGPEDARDPEALATSSTRALVVLAAPVALAVGAYGLSYGVLAVAAGLSPAIATLSSLLVLAGGSQFAFVGVLALGGNPFAGAVSGLLLNMRYVAFGLAIARALPAGSLRRRAVDSYLVVDESVALAHGKAGPRPSEPSARHRWSVEV